jgi:hypothetical protein
MTEVPGLEWIQISERGFTNRYRGVEDEATSAGGLRL